MLNVIEVYSVPSEMEQMYRHDCTYKHSLCTKITTNYRVHAVPLLRLGYFIAKQTLKV
jgi:hypothetical protein